MSDRGEFSFVRWLSAGFAFGLGLISAVIVCFVITVIFAGAYMMKKGQDMIQHVVSGGFSSGSTTMVEAEGVYLINTNFSMTGSVLIVSGVLTNATDMDAKDLFVSATLEGEFESESSTWQTEWIDVFASGDSQELSFVFEEVHGSPDLNQLKLDLEIQKTADDPFAPIEP